jgi:hypothetical protein
MRLITSRYNHDISWFKDYEWEEIVIYDRSEVPVENSIVVPNIGSDLYDKLTYIINNYENIPKEAIYTKANLFKYISREEFELVRNNTTFTPLLTQHHTTYMPVCYYADGIYWEIGNFWYLNEHPPKNKESFEELKKLLGLDKRAYNAFAPGSNYILTREDIQRHSKEFYIKLRSFLEWSRYPGEAFMLERSLYYLWGTDTIAGI